MDANRLPAPDQTPDRATLIDAALEDAAGLTRFLDSRVGDAVEAQDLMQELYLPLLRLRGPLAIRSPKAYLYPVATHLVCEHRRKCRAHPSILSFDELGPEAPELSTSVAHCPESAATLREAIELLARRLADLPPKVQAALL